VFKRILKINYVQNNLGPVADQFFKISSCLCVFHTKDTHNNSNDVNEHVFGMFVPLYAANHFLLALFLSLPNPDLSASPEGQLNHYSN